MDTDRKFVADWFRAIIAAIYEVGAVIMLYFAAAGAADFEGYILEAEIEYVRFLNWRHVHDCLYWLAAPLVTTAHDEEEINKRIRYCMAEAAWEFGRDDEALPTLSFVASGPGGSLDRFSKQV